MKQRTPWCKKRFTTSNDLEINLRIYSPWLARTPAGATPARTPAGGMFIKIRCTFVGILARATYVRTVGKGLGGIRKAYLQATF